MTTRVAPFPVVQIMGGPRVLNDEPDFGTFGGEGQRYGDKTGGGWGGGGGVANDGPAAA